MTQDEIIEMASQVYGECVWHESALLRLEAFVKLVAAKAIAELKSQEPVAWRAPNWGHSADEYVYRDFDDPVIGVNGKPSPNNEPLYAHPPQRTWVELTDEEFWELDKEDLSLRQFVQAIEAKLKEKNT